jgi:hypothetical protein
MVRESTIGHKTWPCRGEFKARLALAASKDEKMVDALASESRGSAEGRMIPDGRRL